MAVAAEQLKELRLHIQKSPHRKYGDNEGVPVSVVADVFGVEATELLKAMGEKEKDFISVLNGKGYDLRPPYPSAPEKAPSSEELWLYTGWWSRTEEAAKRKAISPVILKAAYDVYLDNEYVRAYYSAEDKIITALEAIKRGDINTCKRYCEIAQDEILTAIKRRCAGQCEFRQAMENLYTKPSLNGCSREKPPKSDDDEVQRSFRNFQSKIAVALQAAELQRADVCEKYCGSALRSVSLQMLRKIEEGTAHV